MKKGSLILVMLLFCINTFSQKMPTEIVENIKTTEGIQLAEFVANELNYSLDKFDEKNKILTTKYIEWTSLAIMNRAVLKFEVSNNQLTITMIERQYKSDQGWVNSPMNLSKKNHKKYLEIFALRVTEVNADKKTKLQALSSSKLIKMFQHTIEEDGFVFKFIRFEKNKTGDLMTNPNMVLEVSVTNVSGKPVKLRNPGGPSTVSFKEVKTELRFINYSVDLAHNETVKLFFYFRNQNKDVLDEMFVSFGVMGDNERTVKITNYNVPVPFEIKENDSDISNIDLNEVEATIPTDGEQTSHPGVYESFLITRTENPKLQLAALHNDGSMVGFQLSEDLRVLKAITFRKNDTLSDFILLFNEDGSPKAARFGNDTYSFQRTEGEIYRVTNCNLSGEIINTSEIEFVPTLVRNINQEPYKSGKGPHAEEFLYAIDWGSFCYEILDQGSRFINIASCGAGIVTGPLTAIGPCGALVLDEIIRYVGEEHPYYKELVLAKNIFGLASMFPNPTKVVQNFDLDNFNTMLGGIIGSVDGLEEFLNKFVKPSESIENNIQSIMTSELDYERENGIAEITVLYKKLFTKKDKVIAIYKMNDDLSYSYYDEVIVDTHEGEVNFSIPFNGKYEARVYYDAENKNMCPFTIHGDDVAANPKFKNTRCMEIVFASGINAKWYSPNTQDEPEKTAILPCDMELASCVNSEISFYNLKPLVITWSGNSFFATATRLKTSSTVTFLIRGEISTDGKTIKKINYKMTAIKENIYNNSVEKEIKDITLENIIYDPKRKGFIAYKNKYGSTSGAENTLIDLKYRKTIIYSETTDYNYLVKYFKNNEYWTSYDGNFSLKLFFRE